MDNPYPTMHWSLDGNAESDDRFLSGDLAVSGTGSPWANTGFWTGNGTDDYLSARWADNEANFDAVFNIADGAFLLCARVLFRDGDNLTDATVFKAGTNFQNRGVELYWNGVDKYRCVVGDDNNNTSFKVITESLGASEDGNLYNLYVWADNRDQAKTHLFFDNTAGADPTAGDMGFLGVFGDITGGDDVTNTEDRMISIGARSISNGGTIGRFYKGSVQRVWAVNFGQAVPWYMNQFLINLNNDNLDGDWWDVA